MNRHSRTSWRQSINNRTKKYETLLTDEAKICIIQNKINTQRVVKDAGSLSAVSFSIHWTGVQLAGPCHSWFHAIFIVAALGAKSVAGKTLGGRFSTPLSSVACCKCVSRATRPRRFLFSFSLFSSPGQAKIWLFVDQLLLLLQDNNAHKAVYFPTIFHPPSPFQPIQPAIFPCRVFPDAVRFPWVSCDGFAAYPYACLSKDIDW